MLYIWLFSIENNQKKRGLKPSLELRIAGSMKKINYIKRKELELLYSLVGGTCITQLG